MPEAFRIEGPVESGRFAVLRVWGHLNAATAAELLDRARLLRDQSRPLLVNLSGVSFIASSGVGALLALGEEYREAELEICYVELSSAVESVIKLLNLDAFLAIASSEEEAQSRAA